MSIEVDASEVIKSLDDMLQRLSFMKRVGIGKEMDAWQTDNLHRKKPFTLRWRGKARTTIHPHSFHETVRSSEYQAGVTKYVKRLARRKRTPKGSQLRRIQIKTSTRPILRSGLSQELMERERQRLSEELTWE